MSKPAVTVESGPNVTGAAKRLSQGQIRRLAVMDDGKLMGIWTMKDILEVTPAIIDLASEKSQAGLGRIPRTSSSRLQGYCDECETWSEALVQKDGVFLCQDCAKELGPVEEE